MGAPFSIICLSSQEWRADLPTNRQQIMKRAAKRGHEVLFIEAGDFIGKHLWRLLRGPDRASQARRLFATEKVIPGVRVRTDVNLFPWGTRYRIVGWLNGWPTGLVLAGLARALPQPVILWIYHPATITLAGRCGEAFVVYDCVDDYAEQARDARRRGLFARADARAGEIARLVFATTSTLYERNLARNSQTFLVPNVADYEHFVTAADRRITADDVSALPRPVVGFAGNLVASKVDFDLVAAIAGARPDWSLLLIGPLDPAAEPMMKRLLAHGNVHWVGQRSYEELPAYIAAFDVGIIPYVSNAYTRSCFPLKLYEYLAAGKAVVASGLPDLAGKQPDVVLAAGVEEFVAGAEAALSASTESDQRRRQTLAAQNTWETRATRLLELVTDELAA